MAAPKKVPAKKPAAPAAPEKEWFINGSLMFSIDKTDKRTVEQVQNDIKKAIEKIVKNVTFTGSQYVVDGKSYRMADFDPKTGLVREGALYIGENPTARNPVHLKTVAETIAAQGSRKPKSVREALDDNRTAMGRNVQTRGTSSDPEVEFDWDESDFGTDEVAQVAEAKVEDAVKKMTATPKKVPAKKVAAPAKKKPVRRGTR